MPQAVSRLNPPALPDVSGLGYSQISIAEPGRLAFVSGQVAVPPGGGPTPAGLAEQVQLVVRNARAALDALGASPGDIVVARAYMVDLTPERLEEGMPHLMTLFDGARPSLTGVGVAALAGPDLQVEMEMIVRLPG